MEDFEIEEEQTPVKRRTGGRSARVRDSVLRATWETLLELGVDGLTFSEIGRRSGVHGTSIQRRWGSRENVLFEALLDFGREAIPVPDTGALHSDLTKMFQALSAYFASPIGAAILQMIVANADNDRAFADHRAEFVRIRMDAMRAIIQRAAARGELRSDVDEEAALDLVLGPLYVRALITRRPIDNAFISGTIDMLVHGLVSGAATTP